MREVVEIEWEGDKRYNCSGTFLKCRCFPFLSILKSLRVGNLKGNLAYVSSGTLYATLQISYRHIRKWEFTLQNSWKLKPDVLKSINYFSWSLGIEVVRIWETTSACSVRKRGGKMTSVSFSNKEFCLSWTQLILVHVGPISCMFWWGFRIS